MPDRRCPRCPQPSRPISADRAAFLYQKLTPFLSVRESWGCYTPQRGTARAGEHSAWPLHAWRGPGSFPLVLEWAPSRGPRPTFAQFIRAYGLEVVSP